MVGRGPSKRDFIALIQEQIVQQRSSAISISSFHLSASDDHVVAPLVCDRRRHSQIVVTKKEQPNTPIGLLNVIDPADRCAGNWRLYDKRNEYEADNR
jgi:hypothetical protein